MTAPAQVPVVDCKDLRANPADSALVEAITDACTRVGGFVATGCGPTATCEAFRQARQFFALPEQVRRAVASDRNNRGWTAYRSETSAGRGPDVKEAFQVGRDLAPDHPLVVAGTPLHGPNQWPALPGFRPIIEQLFDEVQELCRRLSVPLALGLGLNGAALRTLLKEPYASMRLHRYPAVKSGLVRADEDFGHAAHTDFGALGIVLQEEDGGLQAEWTGTWIDVPGGDRVTVIAGDLLAWWSEGRYRALRHQVPIPRQRDRYSIAAFVNPGFTRMLHPMNDDGTQGQGCGDFIMNAARDRRALARTNG